MTLLRSLIVAVLAVLAAQPLRALLSDPRPRARRCAWILLLAPYLTPLLLTGYAFANFSLSLIHHPAINTIFYAALLWCKFTPIAAVVLHFAPAPISAEAIHCFRLNRAGAPASRSIADWAFLFRAGCARAPVAAFAAVFLFVFGEFEMASLMSVRSWTVALFDAHAGGLALSESLRRMLGPLACEATAVAIAIVLIGRQRIAAPVRVATGSRTGRAFGWSYLVLAFVLVLAIPAGMILWGTFRGFGLLISNFVLGREIITSLLFAAGATLFAGLIVLGLKPVARRGWFAPALRNGIVIGMAFAGLLGPLVLSLVVLAAAQLPGLLPLRDTPVPLVITLGLILIPVALVLKRVLELTGHQASLHLARLMPESRSARELIWRLSTNGKFWTAVLLFTWAYWDLTASAILAPVGMTPVTVRLYNLMHYGRIAALSAMTCAAIAAPAMVFALGWGTRRWWAPR